MDNMQQSNHTGDAEMNNFVGVSRMSSMWPFPHQVDRFQQFRDFFHENSAPPVINDTGSNVTQVLTNNSNQHPMVNSNNAPQQHAIVNSVPVMGTLQTVLTQGLNSNINVVNHTPQSHSAATVPVQSNNSQVPENTTQILTRLRLQDLVREVDPNEQLDEDVEDVLLQMADDFVDSAISAACLLAKHRKSSTVEVKDLQLHLERNWNMWIPGFGTDELRPYKRSTVTEAHKQRLTLIRKTLKKY